MQLIGRDGYTAEKPLAGSFKIVWEPTTSKLEGKECMCDTKDEQGNPVKGTQIVFEWRLIAKLEVKTTKTHILVLKDEQKWKKECPCVPPKKDDTPKKEETRKETETVVR